MTTTTSPDRASAVRELRQTYCTERIAEGRLRCDLYAAAASIDSLDLPSYGLSFMLSTASTSGQVEPFPANADEDTQREFALAWIARHVAGARAIAAEVGCALNVSKDVDDAHFGVSLEFSLVDDDGRTVKTWGRAVVPTAVTCEYVPTGKMTEPTEILERRCPPSIFAPIADRLHEVMADG